MKCLNVVCKQMELKIPNWRKISIVMPQVQASSKVLKIKLEFLIHLIQQKTVDLQKLIKLTIKILYLMA